MKLYSIGLLFAFLLTGTLSAQNINIGIKGGLNSYNITPGDFNPKTGIHLGLLGHIHMTDQIGLQPEIYYSAQGAKFGNSSNSLNLDYINIPLLLQYMFDNGFRVQAGPQLGLLMNAKSVTGSTEVDVKNDFKSIDVGIGVGASYIHLPTGFGIDARYNIGMSNISEIASNDYKNRGFQLGVFYLFNHTN
ncbi:porin family protein [Algoriphagus hitonicola]|uniref:Outer membrane protein beta-barrel domain-containing protein n=1 Tax=Algoriphagus hitonicola TaxID=435880 RepID=A0A1I2QAB0_9BACT|nr:porin family protein [Algoriphagus hitonicola]SFG22581.1 Outer membrane protein beta-barrel domain-containing protein [Algoriphagus hitonicola]